MSHATIPFWVPAIFIGLIWLGTRQARARLVKPGTQLLVAAGLCALSLSGVSSAFGSSAAVLLSWAAGYALGLAAGLRLPSLCALQAVGERVRLPGSWVPMVLLMLTFTAKFVLGYATAVHLPLLQEPAVATSLSVALGALTGAFGARAVAVLRCAWAVRPVGAMA